MIRPFREEDSEAVAELVRAVDPEAVMTGALVRHWLESQPERARAGMWVAEEDGTVAGWARARLDWATSAPGTASFWGCVEAGRRRGGIGTGLLGTVERRLAEAGAATLRTWAGDAAGRAFLERHGFGETGRERKSVLRPADVASRDPVVPEGFRLAPLRDVLDRPRELYELYATSLGDVPMLWREDDVRLEEWLEETLGSPALDPDGSFVVLAEERPVAFAWLETDRERGLAANEMTGTLPEFRRRGLARAAKFATIEWAREAGVTAIWTTNDEPNAAMLRLNEDLGYRSTGVEVGYTRTLRGGLLSCGT